MIRADFPELLGLIALLAGVQATAFKPATGLRIDGGGKLARQGITLGRVVNVG